MVAGLKVARRALAVLTAYALLLHVLFMAAVASPRLDAEASLMAQLQVICSGQTTVRGDLPAQPSDNHVSPPCALCGLGGGALVVPAAYSVALPVNVFETLALSVPSPAPPREQRAGRSIQPRAPPIFS